MSKKKLYKKFLELEKENQLLREENAYLKFQLEEFRAKRYKPNKKKPPEDKQPQAPPEKKGGLFGHIGWFRKKPKKIDKIEDVTLDACPECGSSDITECKTVEEHIQEDIILPRAEVTLFRKHKYYCKVCRKTIAAKGKTELAKSYIGPKAKALAAFLKYAVKISERDIAGIFNKVFKLNIAASSITGFRDQLKKEALPVYQRLIDALKQSSFIHMDETGWNINGDNHWLWKLSNKKISITHIDKSRGQRVVEELLGEGYGGVLISDFLSAYNKIKTKGKQRCLIHILRDLKKVIKYWHDDKEVLRYCKRLKRLFEESIKLYQQYQDREWDEAYYRKRLLITQRLKDFYFPNPNKRILQRFVKRLNRHKDELFTFLYTKDIDYHNNHAEQQI
ncbi:MAG: IS66 family transposase, partial [Candidatus Omnitrophica bacterium]|nr:IS66 family transposase [Candidatus Omnitrophota bacterium]